MPNVSSPAATAIKMLRLAVGRTAAVTRSPLTQLVANTGATSASCASTAAAQKATTGSNHLIASVASSKSSIAAKMSSSSENLAAATASVAVNLEQAIPSVSVMVTSPTLPAANFKSRSEKCVRAPVPICRRCALGRHEDRPL